MLSCSPSAGPTVVPAQYYGVPWGVYPTNLIQQSATPPQRRPLTPSSANTQDTQNNLTQVSIQWVKSKSVQK